MPLRLLLLAWSSGWKGGPGLWGTQLGMELLGWGGAPGLWVMQLRGWEAPHMVRTATPAASAAANAD